MMPRIPTILAALVLCLLTTVAKAQLASPGKLSNAHKNLEGVGNCAKCHNFGEKSFRNNCLGCHTEIRSRVNDGQGYHHFTKKLECSTCHKEHHGREFKLIRWDPEAFEHKQTGFLLEARHDGLECRKCHNPDNIHAADIRKKGSARVKQTYLGLATECSNCHEDEHRGQLGKCDRCHTPQEWKKNSFSHDKSKFALVGKHASVACVSCHPEKDDGKQRNGDTKYKQFKGIAFSTCLSCHEDHHKGTFGKECKQCHTPAGWKNVSIAGGNFDHAKTHFPLEGRHRGLQCVQCHIGGDFARFKNADLTHCVLCHKDYHEGDFAQSEDKGACERCHNLNGFSPARFEPAQHESTRFPLRGAHAAVSCTTCHAKANADGTRKHQFRWKTLECLACHADPHAGQLNERIARDGCQGCHNVESWYVTQFDHTSTRFALTGAHRTALCERCHTRGEITGVVTIRFRYADIRCVACHADKHDGQFAAADGVTDCARCHTTPAWKPVQFDHVTMSRFALTGKHTEIACERCHLIAGPDGSQPVMRFKPLETACSSCHTTGR